MEAFAELNERGDRCEVHFHYSKVAVDAMHRVPGATFVPIDKGGPYWRLPLDMTSMRRLREEFKEGLTLGAGLRAWGRGAVKKERELHKLAVADDWPIEDLIVTSKLPKLANWFRPYQRADVKFLGAASAMNLLQPRLGKTAETIGAVYEANLEHGFHLIVAPQKTTDTVWRMEFERWTDLTVFTFTGETPKRQRDQLFDEVWDHIEEDEPFVFATTADMIRRGLPDELELEVWWSSFTIDEFHKTGLPKAKNVFPKKASKIKLVEGGRRWALSGTPMGGKPIKLWGGLNFLYKDLFTSRIRWEDQWLEVETVHVGREKHRKVSGVRPEREEEFYKHLAPYAVRRKRSEVLPQLPPVITVDVWYDMTRNQDKQYNTFAAQAEIRIDEYHLSATSILAEYTRLKQFAGAVCEVELIGEDLETGKLELKLKPTFDAGMLPQLMEKLSEVGIDPKEPEGNEQAIVSSQFRETIEMVYNYLDDMGIPCIKLTGKSKKADSETAQRAFKRGADNEGLRVVCMVTTIGVGITLDNVESVHILDETWNPDDQEQLIDRAVNTSSLHQITAFFYRPRGTIATDIYEVTGGKMEVNDLVLDKLRERFKRK